MRGNKNSVLTWIRVKCPYLYEIHCICHGAHLASLENSKNFIPKEVEFLINQITAWFSNSPKESGILKRIQEE